MRFNGVVRSPETETGSAGAPPAAAIPEPAAHAPPAAHEPAAEAAAPAPKDTPSAAPKADEPKGEREAPKSEPSLITATEDKAGKTPGESKEPAPAEGNAEKDKVEKPAETKTAANSAEPEKKADGADEPPTPEPVKYEPWTLPEGAQVDGERIKAFEALAGEGRLSQEIAQKLLDQHMAEIKSVQEQAQRDQRRVWDEMISGWKDEFRKDPELGGNREKTTLATAKAVIEEFGGTKEQRAEFYRQIDNNGMGNHVGLVRLLNNIGKKLGVFEDSMVGSPSAPLNGGKPRSETWYPNSHSKMTGEARA